MSSMPVNLVDIAFIVVLLVSGVMAFFRGLVHEVLAVVAWVGAAFAGLYGMPYLRPVVRQQIVDIAWAADAISFAGIFVACLLVLALITRFVAARVRGSALGSVDRSLGFVFGVARGALLATLAYMLAVWLIEPGEPPTVLAEARTRPLMDYGAELLVGLMPNELGGVRDSARKAAEDARKAAELERAYRAWAQPEPKAAGELPKDSTGYGTSERRAMDRLIETNQ